jgi:hypothetical protein
MDGASRGSGTDRAEGMKRKPTKEPKARLRGLFEDLMRDPAEIGVLSFCKHVVNLLALPAEQRWPAFKAHYTARGEVDENKVATDLATWGPIASRVVELQLARRSEAPA